MAKYRKKPVVVEAMRFSELDDVYELCDWCGGYFQEAPINPRSNFEDTGPTGIKIPTIEGVMTAQLDDWIIKGIKGEFYPCKPDIFAATYELVEE